VGSHELVAAILAAGGDPNRAKSREQFFTPVHVAVKRGYVDILTTLLDKGGDPNAGASRRGTASPLHVAAATKADVAQLLISRGANKYAIDGLGEPPLFGAIRARELENVKLLADAQTLKVENLRGQSALHIAAETGHPEIVAFLVEQSPLQVYAVDKALNTPLHVALAARKREVMEYLLEAGADVMARNRAGESVFAGVTGEFRLLVQRFVAAHPNECKPSPIQRTRKIVTVAPTPGKAPSKTRQSRSGSSAWPDNVAELQDAINAEIDMTRKTMKERLAEVKRVFEELKIDAQS
jgi:hypothetical protein